MASVRVLGEELLLADLTPDALRAADCVVIVTDHRAFDWAMVAKHARVIVDTRNAIARAGVAATKVLGI